MRASLAQILAAFLLFSAACGGSNAAPSGSGGGAGNPSTGGAGGTGGASSGDGGAPPICGGLQGSEISAKDFPADCKGLGDADTFACAEKRFWLVTRDEFEARPAFYDALSEAIAALAPSGDPKQVANLYFRRGQLAMELALENDQLQMILEVRPDFDQALALYPDHPIVPTWRDTLDIAFAAMTNDEAKLKELFEKALANVSLCPLGNIPSLTGTTIGLPLNTGIPQQTIALAQTWKCEGVVWCTDNTWKAPYAVAGMRYHLGEAFARMGDKERALEYFASATQAPDFAAWPYAAFVEEKIQNIDALLEQFAELGQDGSAFDRMYSNSEFGCKFCHATK